MKKSNRNIKNLTFAFENEEREKKNLHWRFGAEPQNEFVRLRFDDFFGDVVMGQGRDATEQRDVALSQLEDGAILDAAGQEHVTDQRPRLDGTFFFVVLFNKIKD